MSLLAIKGKVIKPVIKLNLATARESVDHESFEPAKTDFPPFSRDFLLVAKMKPLKVHKATHINHIAYKQFILWSVHLLTLTENGSSTSSMRNRIFPCYIVLQDTTYFSVFPIKKSCFLLACLFVAMVRTESIHTIKAAAYHINLGPPPH